MNRTELIVHKTKLVRLNIYYNLTSKELTLVKQKIKEINHHLTTNRGSYSNENKIIKNYINKRSV